jgi:uncharacterized protein (UPF0128 family)
MNQQFYNRLYFYKNEAPKIPCPTCSGGHLVALEGYLRGEVNAQTFRNQKYVDWERENEQQHFSAILKCDNKACLESVHVIGIGRVDDREMGESEIGEPYFRLEMTYEPTFFLPPLRLFEIPRKTPQTVRQQVISSFQVFFVDSPAAANHVRSAVEVLLTELKVPLKKKTKKGKLDRLSTHARIDLLKLRKHERLKELLTAAKWIGNHGSHSDELTRESVMVAYAMLENCLQSLYGNVQDLPTLAKAINKKKGPVSPPLRRFSLRLGKRTKKRGATV